MNPKVVTIAVNKPEIIIQGAIPALRRRMSWFRCTHGGLTPNRARWLLLNEFRRDLSHDGCPKLAVDHIIQGLKDNEHLWFSPSAPQMTPETPLVLSEHP